MVDRDSLVHFADDIEPADGDDELNRSGLSQTSSEAGGVTSSGSLRTNHAGAAMMAPTVERSISENTPLLLQSDRFNYIGIISGNYAPEDSEFGRVFSDVEQAINHGICPQRILRGSSGSYFVRNSVGVGIFIMSITNSNYYHSETQL